MCHISHRFIKEVEDRIADSLMEGIIGEDIGLILEIVMMVIEVMDMVEVILGEVIFRGRYNNRGRYNSNREVDRTWENRRKWRQSRSRERNRDSQSWSPSSSRLRSRTNTNRDRIRCFRCREYDHFANECPNQATDDSDRESDSARSVSLHLADRDTGSDAEQYLNA